MQAYRHATCWGMEDVLGGHANQDAPRTGTSTTATAAITASKPSSAAGAAASGGLPGGAHVHANGAPPLVLGARLALRRELMDLTFRYDESSHSIVLG